MMGSTGLMFFMVCSFLTGYYSGCGCQPSIPIIIAAVALVIALAGLRKCSMSMFLAASFLTGASISGMISPENRFFSSIEQRGGVYHCSVITTTTRGALLEVSDYGTLWCGDPSLAAAVSRGDSAVLLGSIDNGFLNACAFRGILSSSVQNNLRRQIASMLAGRIPSRETSSLATALLSGERGKLPSRMRELFRRTGISHLLAVSGLHVGFITAALLLLFRKLAGRSVLSVLLVILLMSFYVFLAGARASTVRAGVMGGIVLVCFQARGRIPDFRSIWSAGVICILIVSGMEVLADVGAQMSFSAVLSLAIMGRTFSMPFGRILSILYAGFIVTLALAPLVFSVYGSLSPVAPLATLLSMPFMLATMLLGILTLAAGSLLPGIPVLLEWTVYLWLKTVKLLDLGLMNCSKWMIPIWVSAIVILVLLSRRGRFFRRFS